MFQSDNWKLKEMSSIVSLEVIQNIISYSVASHLVILDRIIQGKFDSRKFTVKSAYWFLDNINDGEQQWGWNFIWKLACWYSYSANVPLAYDSKQVINEC